MSINIKTSSGLQKLTPEVNKSTISSALGYTPTDDTKLNEHASNRDIHVTASDKIKWDNNGDFNNLSNKPNIVDDDSGTFNITDSTGNIALQVASDGITRVAALEINNKDFATAVNDAVIIPELPEWTQDIQDDGQGTYAIVDEQGRKALEISADGITNLAKLQIKGEDLETIIDNKIPEEVDPYIEEWADTRHSETLIPEDKLPYSIVPSSRKVNGKELSSDINLALSDLNEAPNIVETDDGSFVIANENGVKAFEITHDGTTSVAALTIDGKTLESIIDGKIPDLDYSVIVPENETDPTVSSWAKINNTDKIPEDKLPSETDPTVASWAKEGNNDVIPNTKIPAPNLSSCVPTSRTVNGYALTTDITLSASDVGLGDVNVDEDGSFVLVDTNSNKAFEVTSNGTVTVAKLSVGGADINEQLNALTDEFDNYQPKGSYLTTSTASNTYLAKAGGAMAGAITMNGNNISGAGTITAAAF
jgi:hypothetical protein